jgi:hypothetical protein
MSREKYDPTWLVELAKKQLPEIEWLPAALEVCTEAERTEDGYGEVVVFIDRMEGKFKENIILIEPKVGRIALDILIDDRVAGYSVIEMPFANAYTE